jgi:hypothetical protein
VGGSERQLALMASGLAQRGHDVAIAVLYGGGALESMVRDHGVRLLPIGKAGRWDLLGPWARLWRLFSAERPDVIYAFLPAQTASAALVLPPWLPTRLVFGVRAGGMRLVHYDWLAGLSYRLEALLSRRAALVIANAQAVLEDAIGRGLRDVGSQVLSRMLIFGSSRAGRALMAIARALTKIRPQLFGFQCLVAARPRPTLGTLLTHAEAAVEEKQATYLAAE